VSAEELPPEVSPTELLALGERYAAMGLTSAARSCLARASEFDTDDATALRRLVELCIAMGQGKDARGYAADLRKRDTGVATILLTGNAQLAAGELSGARFSYAAVADAVRASPLERARAMVGRAKVAEAESDRPGAAANIMGAAEVLAKWMVKGAESSTLDVELPLLDEVIRLAVAWDRGEDIGELSAVLEVDGRKSPGALWRALLLAARQSHGDRTVRDAEIDDALSAELEARPESRVVRVRRCERLLRRRFRDHESRATAIAELEDIATQVANEPDAGIDAARVHLLLASAYEDDPATAEEACVAYERGLSLRPRFALAQSRLASLKISRGDYPGALEHVERALRLDRDHTSVWLIAARLLSLSRLAGERAVARVLEAAEVGAGDAAQSAMQLANAFAAHTRDEVLAGMHARGHRLKNLLGIIGVRARSAQKSVGDPEHEQHIGDLVTALSALHEEWGRYLQTMHAHAAIETVAVAPLVRDVVGAARALSDVAVELEIDGAMPDLKGDRVLLSEALTNIVVNAVQACQAGGAVKVRARPRRATGASSVEIRIDDTGAGIASAELTRVFSPGFTTKEQGSGIGLAVAERVVSAHGGRIHLDSEEGRGTTVTILLPCELTALSSLQSH